MAELFYKENLIPESDWISIINRLESQTKPSDPETLKNAIIDAVKTRIPNEKFGILFSGGVDSTLISFLCKQFAPGQFTCYTVGLKDSPDIKASIEIAKEYNLTHKVLIISPSAVEKTIAKLKTIFKDIPSTENLAVLYGVGVVSYLGLYLAKKDNLKTVFTGLGSEEIFAGYQRHEKSDDINKECWSGLKNMHQRDFKRDTQIGDYLNISCATPFLDKDVILSAMGIPGKEKIKTIDSTKVKKHILRKIAEDLGLKHDFAFRPKKGAQYGASIIKAIKKLAGKTSLKEYLEK